MNLHALPLPTNTELLTPRLRLCATQESDGDEVNAAIQASWLELATWMPWAKVLPSPEESRSHARGAVWKWDKRSEFDFSIRLRRDGRLIGKCSLHTLETLTERAEVGYWLDSRFTGRGLMTEAIARLVVWGEELGFQRLEIRCDARNWLSQNVARRLGFEREGCLRRYVFDNQGRLSDLEIWAKLRETASQ